MKRFHKSAGTEVAEGGHAVLLDGRLIRTPARKPLVVPSLTLAKAIAAEWDAQGEEIDRRAMPLMRMAGTAIDDLAVADEPGHLLRARLGIQRHRVRDLQDPARLHHRHPVGHGHRLGLIVGDIDHGHAELALQGADFHPHLVP